MAEKRWNVQIEVEAPEKDAARLRLLLPEFLRQAGYKTTLGTRTVEVSFLTATENLRCQPPMSESQRPSRWVPQAKRRSRGHGPVG